MYVWDVAINCISGPVSFVALFPQAHRGDFISGIEQGAVWWSDLGQNPHPSSLQVMTSLQFKSLRVKLQHGQLKQGRAFQCRLQWSCWIPQQEAQVICTDRRVGRLGGPGRDIGCNL